jgi:hypothetical protein
MDQSRIAGLGKLLCDETLWRAGIDPPGLPTLVDGEVRRLHRAIRDSLRILVGRIAPGDLTRKRDRSPLPEGRRTCPPDGRRPHDYSCPVHQV